MKRTKVRKGANTKRKRLRKKLKYNYTAPQKRRSVRLVRGNKDEPCEDVSTLARSASVVISVCNEQDTIGSILSEMDKLPLCQVIVVLNGCTDQSFEIARRYPKAIIIHYPEAIGHDVGRVIGTKLTKADIVLYIDGDMLVPASELMPFLIAVDQGVDVALNDITSLLPPFARQDQVTHCKRFLNQVLGRRDLMANSMTAIPHALSRRAIQAVGVLSLMVPPKAQALAIVKGLKVAAVHQVNVITRNRIRQHNVAVGNDVTQLIIGDHLEALDTVIKLIGKTLYMPNESRSDLAKRRNGA
ncbi:glycosyltransferase family 2 protein [Paenibacillus sp. CMAA1364]